VGVPSFFPCPAEALPRGPPRVDAFWTDLFFFLSALLGRAFRLSAKTVLSMVSPSFPGRASTLSVTKRFSPFFRKLTVTHLFLYQLLDETPFFLFPRGRRALYHDVLPTIFVREMPSCQVLGPSRRKLKRFSEQGCDSTTFDIVFGNLFPRR